MSGIHFFLQWKHPADFVVPLILEWINSTFMLVPIEQKGSPQKIVILVKDIHVLVVGFICISFADRFAVTCR